jgi:hypothetical protein
VARVCSDRSTPSSAEVKKSGAVLPVPPICLHGIVLNYLSTGTALFFLPYAKQEDMSVSVCFIYVGVGIKSDTSCSLFVYLLWRLNSFVWHCLGFLFVFH